MDKEEEEVWTGTHREISQFTKLKGLMYLADGQLNLSCSDFFGLILRDMTGGVGMDVVIETSGNYRAVEQGLRATAYGGNFAMVGWLNECHVPINLGYEGHFNQCHFYFSRARSDPNNDYPRWSFKRIRAEAWELLCQGSFGNR